MRNGELQEKNYQNFYSLLEAKPDPILAEAGLAASNGLLDVDHETLRHNKYDNIFGFGDVANLPTTKTWWAAFNQLHVVRHNLERQLNGFSPNAKYDGFTQAFMHTGFANSVNIAHTYDGKSACTLDTGFMSGLRYKMAEKSKKSIMNLLKFKSWGPPYYKFKKTFDSGDSSSKSILGALQPDRKSA